MTENVKWTFSTMRFLNYASYAFLNQTLEKYTYKALDYIQSCTKEFRYFPQLLMIFAEIGFSSVLYIFQIVYAEVNFHFLLKKICYYYYECVGNFS